MLLAELEVWHSRPITPTRRVALGHLVLPVEPPPGFGGLLLGGVVAAHIGAVDAELHVDLHRLVNDVDRGQRIVQPRLRHRYQVDRQGLAVSRHRLVGVGEAIGFEIDHNGSPMQQLLGAVYAAERLGAHVRHEVCTVIHRGLRWTGNGSGPELVSFLTGYDGSRILTASAFADPVAWSLDVLGFPPGTVEPSRKEVTALFRIRLREVHPDHGGDVGDASGRIHDLSEARRILHG